MALYTIGDTHLSFGCEKPMDIFEGWADYAARLESNWRRLVTNGDTVVIPGDISWGMSLAEATPDLRFINDLPGKKILMKGNHDYWWSTRAKMQQFFLENGWDNLIVLQNDVFLYGETAICGTRGWIENPESDADQKVFLRECQRLRLSLEAGRGTGASESIVFLHYPPIYSNYRQQAMIDILAEFGVKKCFYGHVHGKSINYAVNGEIDGIRYKLVSADYLKFSPHFVLN